MFQNLTRSDVYIVLALFVVFIYIMMTTDSGASTTAKDFVFDAAIEFNVEYETALAVCMVESKCKCSVPRGESGEIGPMQVMPIASREVGIPLDTCYNQVRAGVSYLGLALERGGLWLYNQGIYAKERTKKGARYQNLVEEHL